AAKATAAPSQFTFRWTTLKRNETRILGWRHFESLALPISCRSAPASPFRPQRQCLGRTAWWTSCTQWSARRVVGDGTRAFPNGRPTSLSLIDAQQQNRSNSVLLH